MILLTLFAGQAEAQRTFGVRWEVPEDHLEALQELALFGRLGIEIVEIGRPVDDEIWNAAGEQGIDVYAALPIRYPTWRTFAEPDSGFITRLRSQLNHFIPRAEAIRLFSFGAVHDPRFNRAIEPYTEQIRELFDGPLYHLHSGTEGETSPLDFRMVYLRVGPETDPATEGLISPEPGAWAYAPVSEYAPYLGPVKRMLDLTVHRPETPFFVTGSWLIDKLERYPTFGETLRLYATTSDPVFPLPEESLPGAGNMGLGVLLLLVIWGSAALHYSMSPLYRRSIGRFFTSHKFFVNDVLHRHVRASVLSTVMILQHALLSGVLVYGIGRYLFSERGAGALIHHLAWLDFTGNFHLSLFLVGFFGSLGIMTISILWILLCNPRIRYMSQVTNLYIWPLQLNLVTVTLLFALLISGRAEPFVVSILTVLYLVILYSAFLITSMDSSRLLDSKRFWFLAGTVALYTVVVCALLGWILWFTDFLTVLSLALHL